MASGTTHWPGIGGVVFDKDGTLFDFRQSWTGFVRRLIGALAEDGAHGARLAAALGFDLATGDFDPDSPVIADTSENIADSLLPHLPGTFRHTLVERLNDLATQAEMTEAVPLVPLCGALRARGLKLGLATNDVEAAARAHLGAVGAVDLFDAVYGADSGHGAKPEPGMLLAFARVTGLDPARVLMVGDSRHDLIAGRAAGMQTVAVLTGIATAEDLAPLADAVLRDVGDLPAWIDARAAG
jgi:phosphoglycolate phosphatase